jgi:SNF2 family DNA or RNA helicase
MIEHMISRPKSAVHASMGIGKTSATLYVLDFLNMVQEKKTLIVAPKFVAEHTWPQEQLKWGFESLDIAVAVGTPEEREAAVFSKANTVCINYENLLWLEKILKKHRAGKLFKRCVADESTKLKSFRLRKGSSRAKALFKMTKEASYFLELTGTPAGNGWLDLWGQMYFLDQGKRLGSTLSKFKTRYFVPAEGGGEHINWVPGAHAAVLIPERIKDLCRSINAEDYFPVDKPVWNTVKVSLPPRARKLYDQLHKEYFMDLPELTIEAATAADKQGKCLQAAAGAIYTDDESKEWAEIHDEKLNALEVVLGEANGEPVLITYHFKHDAVRIMKRFKQAEMFSGNRIDAWNRGEIPVWLVHPQSVGHGLNLQEGGRRVVIFTKWWSYEYIQQVVERVGPLRQLQAGHPRTVYITEIMAEGTVDDLAARNHATKHKIHLTLQRATKG